MKAVVYDKKSHPDRLVLCDIDKPVPNEHEVLIEVHSVSLNAADYRSMKMGMIPKRKIFGADIAGRIESVGKNITQFKVGDEVIGELAGYGFGGLAEFVTAPENLITLKPAQFSFEEAAALPMAAMTALQALRDKARIQKGQKVLIVGCAGGVGTFAVQLARYFEAEVTGLCSSENVRQTFSLGADHVIDYTREDFSKGHRQYDIILGINGNYSLSSYRKCLAPNGTYVMIGGSLSQIFKSLLLGWIFSFGSVKMKSLAAKTNKDDMDLLASLLGKGIIRPVIDKRYSLDEAAEAMNYIKPGHSRGKVVVNVK